MALLNTPNFKVTPSSTKTQLQSNYISLFDFSSVNAPETHDELASIYGSQSVSGMLYMLGSEGSFASDKYIWTEKGRLHTVYKTVARSGNTFTQAGHVFRKNEKIHVSGASVKRLALITNVIDANTFEAIPYKAAGWGAIGTTALTAFVVGSEFLKGTSGMIGSLDTDFTILENKPIIEKDKFEVNGSDATQIGWVKTDNGGYLWYMQSELDTRRRWEDRVELSAILGEKSEAGSGTEALGYGGTEGLFEAIKKRGNVYQGIADTIPDWDTILKRFDAQGKIKDYMLYDDRDQSLAVDNMLGTLNAGYSTGVSYGLFDNKEEMAVNLGFLGFRRGTYNFFKTDWKLLNDPTLLGAVEAGAGKIRGLLVPVGTKEVYEGSGTGGEKITTPFLKQMYRVAGAENRKYKTWVTGTVGGVYTNDDDVMQQHHLSERMLCTTGANNFMLFEGTE